MAQSPAVRGRPVSFQPRPTLLLPPAAPRRYSDPMPDTGQPEPAEVPAWELEVKPEFDGPMRGFLCPADDEEPPEGAVPALT